MTSHFAHINIQTFSEEELRSMVPDPSNTDLAYQYANPWDSPFSAHQQEYNHLQSPGFDPNFSESPSFGGSPQALNSDSYPYANAGSFTATPSSAT
ncbi:hypothetical protein ACHAPT_001506 [Fusarium lateritium]